MLDDSEFITFPFSITENIEISGILKDLVFKMYWNGCLDVELRDWLTKLLTKLHERKYVTMFSTIFTNFYI